MSAQLSDLSSRARWIVHTQVAALAKDQPQAEPGPRPHPAEGVISAVLAEAAARCDYHIGTQHLLLALFHADDQAAAQALARLGAGESQVREAMTAVLAGTGPEPAA